MANTNKITKQSEGYLQVGNVKNIPDISSNGMELDETGVCFLGPRAENQDVLNKLISKGLEHIHTYRKDYLPGDPEVISQSVKESESYENMLQKMDKNYDNLLEYFNKYSTPFFSLRYQAHMLWDTTLPGIAGYFVGMLHNPNNVTMQASTSTTPLEIVVCKDLCKMIGYKDEQDIIPFSHLTGDGSLSVEEAVWATREMKFLAFAIRETLYKAKKQEEDKYKKLLKAIHIEVSLTNGEKRCFIEGGKYPKATNWELFNIQMSEILAIPEKIAAICGMEENVYAVWDPIEDLNLDSVGWFKMWPKCSDGDIQMPMMITPSTKHYSWPKSGALIGLGWQGVENITVDEYARMDMDKLEKFLQKCLDDKIPLLTVTCVFGSTEESAVDPLDKVIKLRDKFREKGLEFNIHVDGAWGGYLTSVIRKPYSFDTNPKSEIKSTNENIFIENTSDIPLSDYVINQIKSLHKADSMTIDPHKYGYIQYPAGAILYKDGRMKTLTTFSGAYIGGSGTVDPGTAPTVGCFGLEGSRPGATASAVYLSHMCIRPDITGYGTIIKESLWNARRFYTRLLLLQTENFATVTLTPLSNEKEFKEIDKDKKLILESIIDKTKDEIIKHDEAMELIKSIGPDQCIVDYAFNFYNKDGKINTDVEKFKEFNDEIYKLFSLPDDFDMANIHEKNDDGSWKFPLFLTITLFDRDSYGDIFMDTFSKRLGLPEGIKQLPCFRSVVMDPYVSDTVDGSYFKEIIDIMKTNIDKIAIKYKN